MMNTYIVPALSVLFLVLSALDALQTMKLQKLGAEERNPLLGKHPKNETIIAFAVGTSVLWLGAALWLHYKGAPWVEGLLAFGCFLRLWVVVRGYKLHKQMTKDKA